MVTKVSSLTDVISTLGAPAGTTASYSGDPLALGISNQVLAGFPVLKSKAGSNFVVLSSGDATHVTDANTSGSQGTDLGPSGVLGDTATLTLTLSVPAGAKALSFDFTFLSEEYPEFVGSSFNDFFSAKLAGKEFALDTTGNTITVNNNFFNGSIPTTGTFFDGMTPPLSATAPLPSGVASLALQFQVGDVGDGIYDSAAFISNIHFAKNQVVFIDFNSTEVPWNSFASLVGGYDVPKFSAAINQAEVIAELNKIYKDYLVEFTTTKPTSGDFSAIYVTGSDNTNFSGVKGISSGTLGFSLVDPGNSNPNDIGVILTKDFKTTPLTAANLGQVIGHELGHMLGLEHVVDSNQLMYPFGGSTHEAIGGPTALAHIEKINGSQFVVAESATQDSKAELSKNPGLSGSSIVTQKESFLDSFLNLFNLNFSLAASSGFFDPEVAIYDGSDEPPSFIKLPDIDATSKFGFTLPLLKGQSVVFAAKSSAAGDYDVFSVPTGSGSIIGPFDLSKFAVSVPDSAGGLAFDVGKLNASSGSVSVFGSVSGNVSFSAPEFDIIGTEGDDLKLNGTSASESIAGLGGNDVIHGGLGDDIIDGGSGFDTATFAGEQAAYVITKIGNNVVVSGPDGTDTLTNVDKLAFADKVVFLGPPGPPHWLGSGDIGPHPAGWLPIGTGDHNQDGTNDVLWFNATNRDVDLWKIVNGKWAGSVDIGSHPTGWQPGASGDFNADGTSDVLWYNPTSGGVDLWKISNGQWAGSVDVGPHPLGWQPAGSGDFNADGTSDVLWYNPSSGNVDIWKISDGHWAGSVDVGPHPLGWQPVGIGDFDGDGASDVLWYNPTTRDVDLWKISNGHWAGSVDIGSHPAGWTPVGVGDFNQDGTSDVVWFNAANGDVEVWLIANGHWSASVDIGTHPLGWVPAGIGDFDHNGTSDVLWRETSTGRIETWLLAND